MLFTMLKEAVRCGASRTALVDEHVTLSYGQLYGRVQLLSQRLERLGVAAGTRVRIDGAWAHEFVIGFLAAASIGARVLTGQPQLSTRPKPAPASDTELVLVGSALSGTGISSRRQAQIAPAAKPCKYRWNSSLPRLCQTGPVLEIPTDQDGDAVRTQANLVHEAESITEALGFRTAERICCLLSIHGTPGLDVALLTSIQTRSTLFVLTPGNTPPLSDRVLETRPTVLVTDLSTLFEQPCHHVRSLRDGGTVRLILAPRCELLPQVIEARATFAERLVTFYHRPDVGIVAVNNHGGTSECAGRLLPGVRVSIEGVRTMKSSGAVRRSFGSFVSVDGMPRIFSEYGTEILEPGIPGRVVIESRMADLRGTRDGRLHTSEWGFLDIQGELHLLGGLGNTGTLCA